MDEKENENSEEKKKENGVPAIEENEEEKKYEMIWRSK